MIPSKPIRSLRALSWGTLLVIVLPAMAMGLEPSEITILANRRSPEGVSLARYYARQRGIPKGHLLLLDLTTDETCSRDDYEREIAGPVRNYLQTIGPPERIRCLVLLYGIPLRVRSEETDKVDTIGNLEDRQAALQERVENHRKGDTPSAATLAGELDHVRSQLSQQKIATDRVASVDSELMVVRAAAPVDGWIENPFYIGFRNRPEAVPQKDVLMVSRLDGPTPASVRRIIDDALGAEKEGLAGIAYFDARWPDDPAARLSGYKLYDASIHRAAGQVRKNRGMPVRIDASEALFQPGQCPRAALYCGWYRLATYVDAFAWQKGAIGYHIASSECTTLKSKASQVWCKRMLEEGVCATLGPVGEPYVQAFPLPEIFFGFLSEGILSLAECYLVSLPYLSWKMVLIGDPLYHPFATHPSK